MGNGSVGGVGGGQTVDKSTQGLSQADKAQVAQQYNSTTARGDVNMSEGAKTVMNAATYTEYVATTSDGTFHGPGVARQDDHLGTTGGTTVKANYLGHAMQDGATRSGDTITIFSRLVDTSINAKTDAPFADGHEVVSALTRQTIENRIADNSAVEKAHMEGFVTGAKGDKVEMNGRVYHLDRPGDVKDLQKAINARMVHEYSLTEAGKPGDPNEVLSSGHKVGDAAGTSRELIFKRGSDGIYRLVKQQPPTGDAGPTKPKASPVAPRAKLPTDTAGKPTSTGNGDGYTPGPNTFWDPAVGAFFGSDFSSALRGMQEYPKTTDHSDSQLAGQLRNLMDPSLASTAKNASYMNDQVQMLGVPDAMQAKLDQGFICRVMQFEDNGDGRFRRGDTDQDAWISMQQHDGKPFLYIVSKKDGAFVDQTVTDPAEIKHILGELGGQGLPKVPGEPNSNTYSTGTNPVQAITSFDYKTLIQDSVRIAAYDKPLSDRLRARSEQLWEIKNAFQGL